MIPYAVRTPPAITGNFDTLPRFRVSDRASYFIADARLRRSAAIRSIPQNQAYREGYTLFESELEAYKYWLKEVEALNDLTDWSGEGKFSGRAYREAGEPRPAPFFTEVPLYGMESAQSAQMVGLALYDADAGEYVSVALNAGAGANWGWDPLDSRANHLPIIEPIPARQAEPGEEPDGMVYYDLRCELCGSRRILAVPNAEAGWIVSRALERAANEMRQERCG